MHCSRSACRGPSAVRVARCAPPHVRNASFSPAPFFHRFPGALAAHNDFTPFFRLFDDFAGPSARHFNRPGFTFHPRFDVREVEDTYELRGEIPGVEGKDIEVEFTDPQTLTVRGHTEKEATSDNAPAAAVPVEGEGEATKAVADADNSDAESTYSTGSYQKPSVEDDAAETTPLVAETKEAESTPTEKQAEETPAPEQPASRYWVSERATGSFKRVFKFPVRVDQDAVTASLKNGILSIVVPKAAVPAAKKITVE